MSRFFLLPTVGACALLCYVLYAAGPEAFLLACMLVVLEVTLSFDNAVINAKVLEGMSPLWQKRFLTWGIFIAVFGTRVVLPIGIVALVAGMNPFAVAQLAWQTPGEYARLLDDMHYVIAAFGAAFLGMVALKYFFDDTKDVHWVRVVERRFAKWGHIEAVEIGIALFLLSLVAYVVPAHSAEILFAGIAGIVLFIAMEGLTSGMSKRVQNVAASGLAGFLYLNVLDSAFSLDGVIGAFAITSDILVIAVGLGIGAYFVRSMTLYLVREGTLASIRYLEHGAHWAVLGLSLCMGVSLMHDVPEVITAGIGLTCISLAVWSSRA